MQIGTRWPATEAPPASVPAVMAEAITECGIVQGSWTLTWLEGRAVADHSGGIHLEISPDGAVIRADADSAVAGDDDDDWLR